MLSKMAVRVVAHSHWRKAQSLLWDQIMSHPSNPHIWPMLWCYILLRWDFLWTWKHNDNWHPEILICAKPFEDKDIFGFNFYCDCQCDLLFIDAPISDRQYLFSNTTSDRKKYKRGFVIILHIQYTTVKVSV